MKKENPELGVTKNYQLAPRTNQMFEKFYSVRYIFCTEYHLLKTETVTNKCNVASVRMY